MAEGLTISDIIGVADTLISTGILAAVVVLFVRGTLISQPVYERMTESVIERYERLTENVIERVVAEVVARILTGVEGMLKDWEHSILSVEVERLRRERSQLVEELEWESDILSSKGEEGAKERRGKRYG